MSRILPIKKSLDDRFINQDEKITEQALAQLIDGQGGGGYKDHLRISSKGVTPGAGYSVTKLSKLDFVDEFDNCTVEDIDLLFEEPIPFIDVMYTQYGALTEWSRFSLVRLETYFDSDNEDADSYERLVYTGGIMALGLWHDGVALTVEHFTSPSDYYNLTLTIPSDTIVNH